MWVVICFWCLILLKVAGRRFCNGWRVTGKTHLSSSPTNPHIRPSPSQTHPYQVQENDSSQKPPSPTQSGLLAHAPLHNRHFHGEGMSLTGKVVRFFVATYKALAWRHGGHYMLHFDYWHKWGIDRG